MSRQIAKHRVNAAPPMMSTRADSLDVTTAARRAWSPPTNAR